MFQLGGVGGLTPEEYLQGSDRVAAFLEAQGSPLEGWDAADPDEHQPEAEWGFSPSLADDVERFTQTAGYRLRRLRFDHPEDLSPFVADLYRWWYRGERVGKDPERLVVESFFLMDPWHVLQTASVPFWTVFNAETSALAAGRYLDAVDAFDDIRAVVFSHGMSSPGLAPMQSWLALLARARVSSGLLGVDERAYPKNFRVFLRYHNALRRLPLRPHPVTPLALEQLDEFQSVTPLGAPRVA